MAKLIVPTQVVRLRESVTLSRKPTKWHFVRDEVGGLIDLMCNWVICRGTDDMTEYAPVSDVPAADICQKCLGAMRAED
jgi:hypothetical protein